MNEFSRLNNVSGCYWLKESIEDIDIRIKIKPKNGIFTLPKYEKFSSIPTVNLEQLQTSPVEEYTFKWQEKVFSAFQVQIYSDSSNCINDKELEYHERLRKADQRSSKVFTYVDEDYYKPVPECSKRRNDVNNCIVDLTSCMEQVNLNGTNHSNSLRHLFHSEDNIGSIGDYWRTMHIVFDNSVYEEDQVVVKQEAVLVSLYYNTDRKYLIVSPDCNNLELNPYCVESLTGVRWQWLYSVGVESDCSEVGEELIILLKKLRKKWERKHRHLMTFSTPPLGRKQYYLTVEILSATDFEMDGLYVEYNIKLPENVHCLSPIHGLTHVSKARGTEHVNIWNFGHVIELQLETGVNDDLEPLKMYFEVISTDWWNRHRTEGYSYLPLMLRPGRNHEHLSCYRPEEKNTVNAEHRRFFVGGCHLLRDLEVLSMPVSEVTDYKFVTTGKLKIRWSVISQTHLSGMTRKSISQPGASSSSAVLLGAEAALKQYRKARARLAAATEGIEVTHRE